MRPSKREGTARVDRWRCGLIVVSVIGLGSIGGLAESTLPLVPVAAFRPALPSVSPPEKNTAPSDDLRAKLAGLAANLWPDAQRRGVLRETLERAFAGIEPDPEIFGLLENQPEHVAAPWDYMNRLVSDLRLENGRRKLAEHADTLAAIEHRYGVDRHVILAVWGIESSFGALPGTRPVIRSLAILAIGDPRRPQFWRSELLTALTILQRGDITPERMTGSWAGAMGHTQFMPSSYIAHAVDYDGDGRRDIWGSAADALASTANYLKVAGWTSGAAWGVEVVLPAGFDAALSAPGVVKSAAEWHVLGITVPAGRDWPTLGAVSLVLPAGVRGPAFLVGQNFRAILRYNNAVAYALAVGHLADRFGGAGPIAALWPTDDPPLRKAAREDLQRRLAALGHDVGVADGMIGSQTRAAIRLWQRKAGLAEDGYAGTRLLERISQAPAGTQ